SYWIASYIFPLSIISYQFIMRDVDKQFIFVVIYFSSLLVINIVKQLIRTLIKTAIRPHFELTNKTITWLESLRDRNVDLARVSKEHIDLTKEIFELQKGQMTSGISKKEPNT